MRRSLLIKIRANLKKRRRSFTLIELLIVIALVAIIAAIVLYVLNPAELQRQARDSNRFSDSQTIDLGTSLLAVDVSNLFLGNASTTYISVPDPTAPVSGGNNCSGLTGLPTQPPGWTYRCAHPSKYRNVDGSGWLPINFTLASAGSSFGVLPIDPANTVSGNRFYTYVTNGKDYVFTILQESEKYVAKEKASQKDKGTDPTRIEIGRKLLLWAEATGLTAYWPFDEGKGVSGKNYSIDQGLIAEFENGVSWTNGKVGGGVRFDGINDMVTVGASQGYNEPNFGARSFSYGGWANIEAIGNTDHGIIYKGGGGSRGYRLNFWEGGNELYASVTDNSFMSVSASFIKNFLDGTWHHFFAVIDKQANLLKLFVDGEPLAQTNIPGGFSSLTNTGQPLRLGQNALFKGIQDETRIYDRALNETEIKQIYTAQK
ncbi:MAG: Uncharacterized protein G01um101420_496 [Parcubacteria group bacterium Gr01-1014_20]|nr:MAG: Uncharacterized protein G01um101420_496 [Parcubacteria group bacterium Gr01-1014_20]